MHKKPNIRTNDKINTPKINEQISGPNVRLVSDTGSEVVTLESALKKAAEEGLDLVEVSVGQDVPVVKIIDYGKFRFELLKKSREAKKKQHVITIKEVKLRPRIGIHDYEIKKRQALEFLTKGDKVKVTLRFKGRELAHAELGMNVIVKMIDDLKEHGTPEKSPIHDGKQIVVLINPK
ncbi:MAG: translation initiation factor IF-3 [Leptospiraceae bacterium]|nr:translation initiation factor IF-3 [Leptospiraceae bacterium]